MKSCQILNLHNLLAMFCTSSAVVFFYYKTIKYMHLYPKNCMPSAYYPFNVVKEETLVNKNMKHLYFMQ